MSTCRNACILATVSFVICSIPAHAASQIACPTFTAGAGAVGSESYSLFGIIGQALAGHATGTTITIDSGFLFCAGPAAAVVAVTPLTPPPDAPTTTRLFPAAPNPSARRTLLAFDLASAARASLKVFDASGRLIKTFVDSDLPPGRYRFEWSGSGTNGARVGSGIYYCQFHSGALTETQVITLLR